MTAGKFRKDYSAALRAIVGDDALERDKLHAMVKEWSVRIRWAE